MVSDSIFRLIVERLPLPVIITKLDGEVLYRNAAAAGPEDHRFVYTETAPDGLCVFTFGEPVAKSRAIEKALRTHFGLTAREARLARELYDGCSLPECAASLGIGRSTARTHLKSIFSKTHARRQTQLVRLIAAVAIVASATTEGDQTSPPVGGCAPITKNSIVASVQISNQLERSSR